MKKLIAVFMMLLAFSAQAQTLTAQQFENQWEKPVELNAETQWVIVTQVKDAGKIVQATFADLELSDLAQHKLVYIADISGMPGFITKMFALPKMRDYAFPIALIKEDSQLVAMNLGEADKESVLVLQLKGLEVVKSQTFNDQESFQNYLKSDVLSASK
ncbi:hypothetical protein [Thiomicrorhabdus sp. Kp2]|uniref:hypothetical protein n=1 Tax=Thiomicrorhabdus sp. Kp2 TaxID=1123518 RepID=UPI00040194DF|nr:hypothetical protein [Thiomicrorhabdus sp. Kp2]